MSDKIKFFGSSKTSKDGKSPGEKPPSQDKRATPPLRRGQSLSDHYENQLEQQQAQRSQPKAYSYKPTRKSSASSAPDVADQSASSSFVDLPKSAQLPPKPDRPSPKDITTASASESTTSKYRSAVENVHDKNDTVEVSKTANAASVLQTSKDEPSPAVKRQQPSLQATRPVSLSKTQKSSLEQVKAGGQYDKDTVELPPASLKRKPGSATSGSGREVNLTKPGSQPLVTPADISVVLDPLTSVAVTSPEHILPLKISPETVKQNIIAQAPPETVSQETSVRQTDSRKLASFPMTGVQDGQGEQTHPGSRTDAAGRPEEERCTSNMLPSTIVSAEGSPEQMQQQQQQQQQPQVRVLSLKHNEHLDSTLFRLKKGFILQFRPGPTLFGRKVNVFTNYPKYKTDEFDRDRYHGLDWKSDSVNKSDDTALYVEVAIEVAGSFHFYFTYDNNEDKESAQGSGYFLVDPVITRGSSEEELPLDSIQCQTVMSKCLGPLNEWLDRLRVAKESGYNMIHFTPVQQLGSSRSGYSLADQHKLNPDFSTKDREYKMKDLEDIVKKLNIDWKVVSLTDIVLNHTANNSGWLKNHPEATYNVQNSPHLRPAYLLDRTLYHFTIEVASGKWESKGIPKAVNSEKHVEAIQKVLVPEVFNPLHFEEFFQVNVEKLVREFEIQYHSGTPSPGSVDIEERKHELKILQDPNFGRQTSTVNMEQAISLFNTHWPGFNDEESRKKQSVAEFKRYLLHLNHCKREEIERHLQKAVSCTLGTIRYERVQADGPKLAEVSKRHPLTCPYFTHYGPDKSLAEEEMLTFGNQACYVMAHNGWVMGDDPLRNFAEPGSNVYLRRELVAWGDSVKLRYGEKPADSPYLWGHMRHYVEETARIFRGIRLDNCHSTPIHVAEYLLDCARRIRPDLYVIAELFTNSDLTDNIFVNRLGINSLIREAMSAPNSHEEGRLVYRYGGEPVGAFMLPPVRPLVPSVAHAILLDLTHDNRSPCQIRTAWDMLPSTALVNMACCASGSNRGYDEIVPHQIHVVREERKYSSWTVEKKPKIGFVNINSGIISAKKLLNQLHFELGEKGYSQVFVDQVTEHIVTVTRHNPVTHQSVVLVSYTSFRPPANIHHDYIRPLKVQGKFEEIIFEISLKTKDEKDEKKLLPGNYAQHKEFINGMNEFIVDIRERLQPAQSRLLRQVSPYGADTTELEYTSAFRPGSVIAIRLSLLPPAQEAVAKIRRVLCDFGYKKRISEVATTNAELLNIVRNLTLSDLNRVLFRCEAEERDEGRGWGSYNVSNYGPFVYCGLQGIISSLSRIRVQNDLGHPICGNLRDGDWLMDYITGRLKLEESTKRLGQWLEDIFGHLKKVPRYLIPAYFDSLVTIIYLTLVNHAWLLMGEFIAQGSDFVKALGLCSVQFCGVVKTALLPPLSPSLSLPQPPTSRDDKGNLIQTSVSISAGLPHFSVGYMRNWGRDTFIALPGNLLITNRHQEARWVILGFAGTLRHGLIPNLLDGGPKARFNCRDSVWFWLYSIQQYVNIVPNGHQIFQDKVSRLFPMDDSSPQCPGAQDQTLEYVVQEALQRHFEGVKFRERNAGHQIDSQMTDQGFNNEIGVDLNTGFPYGGNIHNCGTWMDKMGSSEKAGNKGKPATPRDGSAVEIVGLCKASLKFLDKMHKEGKFTHSGVKRIDKDGNEINWTYKFWEMKIADNFEKYFWVNDTPDSDNEPRKDLINQRGIYKDINGASKPWTDYQMRCNFPIAIAVAPDMVNPHHAWIALNNVEKILLGPLGIKTLDPSDWKYRGDYDNANDSHDPTVAKGFNYHQGPEWLWPVGWFLRAKLAVSSKLGIVELQRTVGHVSSLLAPHLTHILSSPWRSLPELTNSNGSHCRDSNPAQSWSTGCLLEVLWDIDRLERLIRGSV